MIEKISESSEGSVVDVVRLVGKEVGWVVIADAQENKYGVISVL